MTFFFAARHHGRARPHSLQSADSFCCRFVAAAECVTSFSLSPPPPFIIFIFNGRDGRAAYATGFVVGKAP